MKKNSKKFAQLKKKLYLCIIIIKTNKDMIRVFRTSPKFGNEYKVSVNFRTNVIRVWEKSSYTGQWYRSFLSSVLSRHEIHSIAYTVTPDNFRKFIIEDERISLWR